MSDKTIYDKLNLINQKTNDIKQTLVDYELTTPDEATLENLPIIIGDFLEKSGGINPYEKLYMQKTANETNMKGLFAYTPASSTLDLSNVNTSKATDMSYMFSECKALYLDLSGFDVSNVTNMSYIFQNCTSEIDIDSWDISKLTNASYVFAYFAGSIDISKLDFSNATNISYLFNGANTDGIILTGLSFPKTTSLDRMFYQTSGTTLDLSSWDISNITNMTYLFGFSNYKEIDLTGWKTTNVTNMNSTFYYCSSLEKIIIPDWDMTNTTNTSSFFQSSSKFNYIDLSRSNDATITKIASLVPAKKLATYGQILIPADSSQANIDALIAKYWKPVGPRIDMTSCEIATELDEIKPGKTTKLYYGNSEPWYGNDANVEYVSSDESVATIDKNTMMVVSTGVEGTTEITARIADTQEVISNTITLVVSETDNYPNVIKFRGTSTPTSSNYIKVNGTNVKLSAMDYNNMSGIYTYDAGVPITSIQFNGHGSSTYANTFTDLVKINTSNMKNMSNMFYYCTSLTSLDLSSFDTSKATNMTFMFTSCENLAYLDLSNFDMSNVTENNRMFNNNPKLHTLRLDNCNNITIEKIITLSSFPTNEIEGVTRKIYCKEENAAGLTEPTNWQFEFIAEYNNEILSIPTQRIKEVVIEQENLLLNEETITYDSDNENLMI